MPQFYNDAIDDIPQRNTGSFVAKFLSPDDVPQHARNSFDYGSQSVSDKLLWIDRKCNSCSKTQRVRVCSVRKQIRIKAITGKCHACACRHTCSGIKSNFWNGGRCTVAGGYVKILSKRHPYGDSNGYVFEHRLEMEKSVGRFLLPTETVHHKNGRRSDNRIDNLELRQGEHGRGQRYSDLTAPELSILISWLTDLLNEKLPKAA